MNEIKKQIASLDQEKKKKVRETEELDFKIRELKEGHAVIEK